MSPWVYDPQSGGCKIPKSQHMMFCNKAEKFACTRPWFSNFQLKLRFKNQFCYLDAVRRDEEESFPLGRLRYFRDNTWSFAFYAYSNESYQPCVFPNGKWEGTLEEAIKACEIYLI